MRTHPDKKYLALFASGTGSNAMALIERAKTLPDVEVVFVLSDKAQAPVLEKARAAGVTTYLRESHGDRRLHEAAILELLKKHRIDWIFLAGYMKLLSAEFLKTFASWHGGAPQVVNIHPSLLPAYPGVRAIEKAFADGVAESGVTLHLVDEGMDTGPVLIQRSLPRQAHEGLAQWAQRIHCLEHQIYQDFLQWVAEGKKPTSYFEEK